MNVGEITLLKIFSINAKKGKEEEEILKKIRSLCNHEISLTNLEKFILLLSEVNNDKVDEYIERVTAKDKELKKLEIKTVNQLVSIIKEEMDEAKQKLEKLKKLNPMISFLSEDCKDNLDEDMNNLIEDFNKLQQENCPVKSIIAIDRSEKKKGLKTLFSIDKALTLPSNVFYRFSLKKLFEDNEIGDLDTLFAKIEDIENETKGQISIQKIKDLKVQEFNDEIIQKTKDLMKEQESKNAINESQVSGLIYKHIELNYLEFDKLGDKDKLFLQTTVARIIHINSFKELGTFCDKYFKSEVSQSDDIKCFLKLFKQDDKLLKNFQDFAKTSEKNILKADISELEKMKWPSFDDMGIEVQQASQFFMFWHCVTQLISLKLEDESNESVLLPSISKFLEDKNIYTQFQKKMQQAYIEPTTRNYYVIFESMMKMLNASDIANPDSNFKKVSKNAAIFFDDNPPEFYKISNGIDTLIVNEKKISDLFSTDKANAVIEEYDFVKRVSENKLLWQISFKNHIRLINKNQANQVEADFVKLRLIAAKLNIVMIRTDNVTNMDEYKKSRHFVKFFQTAESLYDKLSILHDLNFDIGDKEITNESLDSTQIEELINNFDKIIQVIDKKFSQVYTDDICLLTKEQFFSLYQLLNKYSKKKEKSPDLVSIFEGTIISTHIAKTQHPVEDYYKLFKDKFESFDFNDDFSDANIEKFEKNLSNFSKILQGAIHQLMNERKNFDEYSTKLDVTGNLDDYLTGGTVRCINANTTSIVNKAKENVDVSSKYQLHSMILYLFQLYRPENNALPLPTQLLICSMSITISQIDSFLEYFNSMTKKGEKCMFIVVSPIQLQPTLYDYLITKLKEINETIISAARIVILFENEDLTKKQIFRDVIRSINVDSFKPISNTENLQNLYKISGSYGIQAYYIYERFPRTGKTHTVLKHINEKYPDHIYTRILVDESTTLTTLINRLNVIRRVDNKGKPIIIHFNVDGKCNTDFHLYVQNLAFFRSLNDGISTPFLVNNNMVFYFEFGSRPSYDKSDFIQNVFPIADYMEEIKIPKKTDEFFTYDEYHTIPHEEIENALMVIKRENYRRYLIEAATIARLDQDKESFLKIDKSALHVRYSDYIDNYLRLYDELEKDPKLAYHYLLGMFKEIKDVPEGFKDPLISQISDVSKIIAKFKGPILSQTIYGTEAAVGYNVRRFLVGLIIEAAVTNCGLPYIPALKDGKVIESSEKDEDRLKKIKEFITRGHMLAVCDPAGDQESQSFTLICSETNDFDDLLKKFNYYVAEKEKYEKVKEAVKSALNVIDSEWKKSQDAPDILFRIFANILSLPKYEEKKYNVAMIVNTWRSLTDDSREEIKGDWEKYIDDFKKKVRDQGLRDHLLELNQKYHKQRDTEEDLRKKRFFDDVQDQVIKGSPFDISVAYDKQNKENRVFVSNDIYTFISNCEKYIQNEESLMLKYTLTPQNIMRFIHLVYRIYSHVPIVLMGETGSGKTFTLNFLSEIIGSNVQLIRRVIDGGTQEEDLRLFLRAKINELSTERSKILKDKLRKIANDSSTPASIIDSINSLPIEEGNEEPLTSFEEIAKKVRSYIDGLKLRDLQNKYDVSSEDEREGFKNYVLFNLQQTYQEIEMEQKTYLFFFDEVNTAPCQWFIKEIILDRYFEGKILPNNIHFVCAVNPSRKLKDTFGQYVLDALDPIYDDDSQDERKNLVYKVGQMPESFVPYLFPADPNREFGSYTITDDKKKKKSDEEYLYDININSEFDVSIDKKVESEFSLMTYQFLPKDNNKDQNKEKNKRKANEVKEGDKHHFSLTEMFSTSFDYSFFYKITNDPKKSLSYSRALSRVLSRINIFCCRLSFHEIYKDVSFSSIRDPERCIQIMRWAYKFGIYEKLDPNLDFKGSIERLRKAFIIGLSVSFWIRLSDQKQKDGSDSHRKMFIDCVCKYWNKLLDECDSVSEVKNDFKAPNYNEWKRIVENECMEYVNLFVDDDECVSKNNALSENIWASFICIMNNIPLWIIGKPGTSKSLALNIVINKLMNQNSRSEKITKCPPLVQQTFMCSNTTTTEAIMDQLGKIVDRSNMYEDDNYVIRIQILEEIGHADMSRFKPLVCLHNIIDNGYTVRPGFSVPVQLIGLSNYKMDSAKLNRGILLLRCSLGEEAIKKTAFDIFKSTNLAMHPEAKEGTKKYEALKKHQKKIEEIGKQYQSKYESSNLTEEKPFIGLRDFYGLIQSITNPIVKGAKDQEEILTLIRRNFSGIPYSKENLNNEKTTDIIQSTMKTVFPNQDFDEGNYFKKLLCPIEANDENDNEEEEDKEKQKETIDNDIEKTTVYYDMTSLIQANINQEHRLLKTPIFRHILISTVNAAALFILIQNDVLKFTNYDKESPYELFFANNMSNLPDAEWISNELRRLTEIMYKGDKTAIFIGKHPCFDSLYDIFNLRYQKEGGGDENDNFVATVSYGGDSYATIVNSNFKAIIIIESEIYEGLPQPFLNRFEKFNLTYETELLDHDRKYAKDMIKDIRKRIQKDLSLAFGCYSDELLLSVTHILDNQEGFMMEDLIDLSIHPSELVYSTKYDTPFDDEEITTALKDNSSLRSSIVHLLNGYNRDLRGDDSVSGCFYKAWKSNKGIKSVVMVPSFANIDKISGYDFVKIDSTNSVNIDSRIKAEVKAIDQKSKESKKKLKPIVLSILISQGDVTVDHVLQYEYTLESIHRWCKEELNITKIPIHTLVIISMEHKLEKLKINQSTEWPLLYLDTCYDDTIKTTENNQYLPLSLEQLVFTPLKTLVDDDIIDLNNLIKTARQSIHAHYTKIENELIDSLIFNDEGYYNFFIHDTIKWLITGKREGEEEGESKIESITGDINDLWTFKKVSLLSSAPSSLIEYLSLKLVNSVGYVMGIIFDLLLSGIDPNLASDIDKKIFKSSDIFNFMMEREEFTDSFYWLFNSESTQVYPIDYRFSYDVQLPGQLSFYKFIWQLALNINESENINTYEDLHDRVRARLFEEGDDNPVTNDFDNLMDSNLKSDESNSSFPFIAAYLLVIADSVRVDSNYNQNFASWISCFIEILINLYSNAVADKPKKKNTKNPVPVKYIMYYLASNKDLINFARNFTITYMFFPNPSSKGKQKLTQSQQSQNKQVFYEKLVMKEVQELISPESPPDDSHIHSVEAYLLCHFISKEFIETINNLNIEDINLANELFRNEFSILLAVYNSLKYCPSFAVDECRIQNEPKYFPFIMTIQKFFVDYGDIIYKEKEASLSVPFKIKPTSDHFDFAKEEDVVKFIPTFVKDCIKRLKFENKIDESLATSSLLMYYLESIYDVYVGLIDPEIDTFDPNAGEGEEEEEEEAAEDGANEEEE